MLTSFRISKGKSHYTLGLGNTWAKSLLVTQDASFPQCICKIQWVEVENEKGEKGILIGWEDLENPHFTSLHLNMDFLRNREKLKRIYSSLREIPNHALTSNVKGGKPSLKDLNLISILGLIRKMS